MSSTKFPVSILVLKFLWYKGEGFDFIAFINDSSTILFLTFLSSKVRFFLTSSSESLLGTISSNKTFFPILAK